MLVTPKVRKWLIGPASDPSVRWRYRSEVEGASAGDRWVKKARREIGRKGWAAAILDLQQPGGHWEVYRKGGPGLYRPKYVSTNFRLIVLSELGMTRKHPRIDRAARLLLDHWSDPKEGIWGEPGSEICITGNGVRMMQRFGYGDDPRVRRAVDWLVSAQKSDGGWHCWPSRTGTIDGWEPMAAFAAIPPASRSAGVLRAIERGAEFYLERGLLREKDGTTNQPWWRIHYPNHYYYDFLVGLDFLTALGYGSDRRLRQALRLLERRRGKDGLWRMDAVHPDLEPADPYHPATPIYPVLLEHLGQPSRWVTVTALSVLARVEAAAE